MKLNGLIGVLLGVSAFNAAEPAIQADASSVDRIRKSLGGQLSPLPVNQTRWYLKDIERAQVAADGGDLTIVARLMRAARSDGEFAGILSTRTGGLVRLPRKFRGDAEIVADLEVGHDSIRSTFDELCPSAELALLAGDGVTIGAGVAELVPVPGRAHPVLIRRDPEFLLYRWSENRWYFRSVAGLLPITPGDGRWVLHIPGGREAPWNAGLWRAIGKAFIRKEHAALHKDNWEAKLANPARVAVAPTGSAEPQRQRWFRQVMAWGVNTVFGLTPGYDVKIVESNGRGHESFEKTIERSGREYKVAVAGQEVTTDGGAGFQNSDIHKAIRADLIKETADGLAHTVNTQVLPPYIASRWGIEKLQNSPAVMEWNVTPPQDQTSAATALVQLGQAIETLSGTLREHGRELDVAELADRFSLPLVAAKGEEKSKAAPLAVVNGGRA